MNCKNREAPLVAGLLFVIFQKEVIPLSPPKAGDLGLRVIYFNYMADNV
jgi:hypothetical protein